MTEVPKTLMTAWSHEQAWLEALPTLVAEAAELWGLDLERPLETPHSLVIPAGEAVLKLNAPSHFEADHEADALERWDANGAVRLLARHDDRRALLLERCRPGARLWDSDVDELEVFGPLLERLTCPAVPPHPFRLLSSEAARWADEIPRRYERGGRSFERRLVDFAVDAFETVDADASHLVNQDLHGGNVLSAQREPWLLIDPKPLVGERELDGVGLLRNGALRGQPLARVLDVLATLGLDRERLRSWGVAHALAWGWEDARGWSAEMIGAARAIHDA
jgi:streptomycin 6-kinase